MHWSAEFVGLPWKDLGRERDGVDCYGLYRLALKYAAGIDLPAYTEDYISALELAEIGALLKGELAKPPWHRIEPGSEREFDLALFHRGRFEAHVGMVIQRPRMLHVCEGLDSHLADYTTSEWRPRLVGFYRHAGLMGER